MKERTGLVKFKENPMTLVGDPIEVGDKTPDFTAVKQDLSEFKLSDLDGKIKIISVVPSLDTGVCQLQTKHFNKEATDLDDSVVMITISNDLPFAQKRFNEEHDINKMMIVSDHKESDFGQKYGLLMKELRLLARAVLVLDKDNTVKFIDINKQVAEEPDYDKALHALKELV